MTESTNIASDHVAAPPSVYLDTGIPSHLTARPSRDLLTLRDQRITCLWWNGYRPRFKSHVSDLVFDEAEKGDAEAAQRRIDVILPLPKLDLTPEALELSRRILREARLPEKAEGDAKHIAIATTAGMDFLLTWNCKHVANDEIIPFVRRACEQSGFRIPEICTPEHIIRSIKNARQSDR